MATKRSLSLKKNKSKTKEREKEEVVEEVSCLPYCGLVNLGYTCYASAVIQSLRYTPGLMDLVKEYKGENGDESLYYSLRELLLEMNVSKEGVAPVINPINLIEKLQGSHFEIGVQHDSQECLSVLIEALLTISRKRKLSNDHKLHPPNKILKGNKKISHFFSPKVATPLIAPLTPPPISLPGSIFEGVLVQETKCFTCEEIQRREESFNILSIPVISRGNDNYCGAYSLLSCLQHFSSVEYLKGNNKYYCKHCIQFTEALHWTAIEKLPQALAIHLKHFSGLESQVKAIGNVSIPLTVSLHDISSNTCVNKMKMYSLYSIILHSGSSCVSGHYTTLVKNVFNWILFDDKSVSEVSNNYVSSLLSPIITTSTPYILFYAIID